MTREPEHDAPKRPAELPDDLVWIEDDAEPPSGQAFADMVNGDAELWEDYRQWLAVCCNRDLARGDEAPAFAVLLAWARATLPAEVMPCVCTDQTCLRCRTAAVVGNR